ncbi:hybrid signal transduction histidine kinase M [Tanacetum coccineum]
MVVDDTIIPPSTPSLSSMEKAFGVTNNKAHVPLVLDLDQLNYDAWSELFTTHYYSFSVLGFLDGTTEELYSLDLGNLTIAEYFKKIKVTPDLLSSIDAAVDEKTLVMYVINGLGDHYDHVPSIIRHNPKRPTLLETRSMLLLEELCMNRKQNCSHTSDNSSSPTVLVASSKANPPKTNTKEICRNFQRGNYRFGSKCRYLHTRNNKQVTGQAT